MPPKGRGGAHSSRPVVGSGRQSSDSSADPSIDFPLQPAETDLQNQIQTRAVVARRRQQEQAARAAQQGGQSVQNRADSSPSATDRVVVERPTRHSLGAQPNPNSARWAWVAVIRREWRQAVATAEP